MDFFTRSHSCVRFQFYVNPLFRIPPEHFCFSAGTLTNVPSEHLFFNVFFFPLEVLQYSPNTEFLASTLRACQKCAEVFELSQHTVWVFASRILSSHLHKHLADPVCLFTRCGQIYLAFSLSSCKPRLPNILPLFEIWPWLMYSLGYVLHSYSS